MQGLAYSILTKEMILGTAGGVLFLVVMGLMSDSGKRVAAEKAFLVFCPAIVICACS